MDVIERLIDIEQLGNGINKNTELLWYKHRNWLIKQVKLLERIKSELGILILSDISEENKNKLIKEWSSTCGKITARIF